MIRVEKLELVFGQTEMERKGMERNGWTDRRNSWNSYLHTQLLSLPKFESNAQKGMSNIVQEAFEYKHLAMAILCLCPPDRSTPSSPTSVSSLSGKILISASRSHAIKTFLYLFSLKFQGHFKTQVYFNFVVGLKYFDILPGAPEHMGTWGHVPTIFWDKVLKMSYF